VDFPWCDAAGQTSPVCRNGVRGIVGDFPRLNLQIGLACAMTSNEIHELLPKVKADGKKDSEGARSEADQGDVRG